MKYSRKIIYNRTSAVSRYRTYKLTKVIFLSIVIARLRFIDLKHPTVFRILPKSEFLKKFLKFNNFI